MMLHVDTPWIGLAALIAMFVVPFLPSWLFEGPRTVKHYPRRHVCGYCGAPWAGDHACATHPAPARQPLRRQPLRGQLRRVRTSTALVRRSPRLPETDD